MKPYKTVMLIASAAAGLAALLPWVHASVGFASESVNGIDGRGDGKITIVIAALVVVFALAEWFWAAVLPVGLLAAAATYELIHITGKVNAYNNDSTNVGHVSIGRAQALMLAETVGPSEAARRLGIRVQTVTAWRAKAKADPEAFAVDVEIGDALIAEATGSYSLAEPRPSDS